MDIVLKTAWARNDPKQMADAKAFWERLELMPSDVREGRAKQIAALAYGDGQVVGVVSAHLNYLPGLRARFAVFQVAVDPEVRRKAVARRLVGYFLSVLEAWSAEHPEEKVMGIAAVIQATEFQEWQREPVWPDWGLSLTLVGYTRRDQQIRVAWFRHARV